MNVQFSENKLIELFCDIDDLHKAFIEYQKSKGLGPSRKPTRTLQLSGSEIATILVAYHYSGYKCFEYYYRQLILGSYAHCFPEAPSYECFLSYISKAIDLMVLWLLLTISRSRRTGLYFGDSKTLKVCHLRREKSHKVFKDLAKKGKGSMGWFYGFKLHLIINNLGEIMSLSITPGNVADNNQELLKKLLSDLKGICVADKGYITQLFDYFYENGLHLLTKPRKNMKKLPIKNQDNLLLDKRGVIESTFDILTSICDIEHTRHRKPINAFTHLIAGLIAYQFLDKKPTVFFPSIDQQLKNAA